MATYIKIASVEVGAGGAASIDFTNIPDSYDDLILYMSVRENGAATIRSSKIRFNNDSSNIYAQRILDGSGSSTGSSSGTDTSILWAVQNDTNSTANAFSNGMLYISNYKASQSKSISIDAVAENSGSSGITRMAGAVYGSNTAITIIKIFGEASNLVQYSSATLYGVAKK
jgi:hypothetical protein